jgi:Holliday junction resolvase-like predicted endonuclease
MNRFNRTRLITTNDSAYQRHVAEMQLQRANQRAIRPPAQRDLFGGEVEDVLRESLAARFPLSDRRIVEYEERKGRNWQRKYRELDAIVFDAPQRAHVFEIKASRRAGAIHRALQQLRDTQAILRLAVRQVGATIIFVDTGTISAAERAELAVAPDAPERLPQTLDEAIADHPELQKVARLDDFALFGDAPQVLVLGVDDIVALAGDRSLSLDWDEDIEDEADLEPRESPALLYATTEDEDVESPFAAALRKAQASRSRRQE